MGIKSIVLAASTLVLSTSVNATYLDLFESTIYAARGAGSGRGISFIADSTFNIDSVGINGDIAFQSYDVMIYNSTDGNQVNTTLASTSYSLGGTGFGWNEIAIDFSFEAGNYYAISWRPTDGSFGDRDSLNFSEDSNLPFTTGPLTLLNGFEGFDAENFSNSLHPNLRVNTSFETPVPIPAAVWLFGSGLLGLVGFSRRKA